jgi:hypothetical protein
MISISGVSTVRYMKKVLLYTKIKFWVKRLRVVANCFLNGNFFHDVLYCCVRYSKVKYQDEIFKKYPYEVLIKR